MGKALSGELSCSCDRSCEHILSFFFFGGGGGGGGAEGVLESWTFENFGVLNLKSNVARDSKLS